MKELLLGNEAVARGAYEAGVKVATAYPGTPSTEVTENIAKYKEIYSEWSPNEKVAMEVAIGASIAGARAIVSMKHVGLNVAADPLFTVSYTGVNGGLVVLVADDPGLHSSQNEQDSRNYARASFIPMLEPSDSQEAKDFTKLAFELSEKYDTPVFVRMTTRTAHSRGLVELGERQENIKPYKKDINKYVMMPGMAKVRHPIVLERVKKLKEFAENADINKLEWNDTSIGIITSGISYQYVKEAVPEASILKLGMVYPLPEKLIREFASRVKKLYVVEELDPFLETEIKAMGIDVIGKEVFPQLYELSAEIIEKAIKGSYSFRYNKLDEKIPVRPPTLCPGCPHRGVYYVLNKLNLLVTGDIGCYTLGALPPLSAMDTCVCMGASVGMAHGMEKAIGKDFSKKVVAVIGDSTFIHSGITGLIDIVYNKGTSTVIILDNSTTGMTGHQDHPATGFTIKKEPTYALDLETLVRAIGIKDVEVVDPYKVDDVERAVKKAIESDRPSVIICRRPCILLDKNRTYKPFYIDNDTCIECGMCMEIGCPAIKNDQGFYNIDVALCNGCGFCSNICPTQSIKEAGDTI
ncbi:indolepyruvate ferredoxin oxidoreductase alpha subunit [Caldanaerobius fijiensis DSM 17918]|uniref:Indolepyruvate oxidoreductase subunit IorA n=1 Tax=Caldanaerobius fijiensis DSM 17918 TaxID=1121256 RepID=A0A1M4T9Q5_9THEO|nr:indolepyruvate ferredoxin oxidoreductase subunit alpha [Caldanaerobius fijiensis]SHE41078.1 indolepyruvate ferredoxin oxidoreductase alpha subunit [Caldanaerobius fijiensis DSM 17918]